MSLADSLEPRARALADLRRSAFVSIVLMLLGVAFVLASVAFSVVRLRPLQTRVDSLGGVLESRRGEIARLEGTRDSLLKEWGFDYAAIKAGTIGAEDVARSIRASEARRALAPLSNPATRELITVELYARDVDREVAGGALRELGYKVRVRAPNPAVPAQTAINTVWFGASVPIADVQLVALSLIRAGVEIHLIMPLLPQRGRERFIEVGSLPPTDPYYAGHKPRDRAYAVSEIEQAKAFPLPD